MSASTTTMPIPAQGTWNLDPAHTTVGFVAKHLVVTKVRGKFEKFSGHVNVAEPVTASAVEVTIETASISTGDAKRDEHLRGADFFDVEKFPTMTFKSTSIQARDETHYVVVGDLTIKDVTKPVTLDVEYHGLQKSPWGSEVAGLSASAELDREEWGLTWNAPLETGGVLVSKKVTLEIDTELTRS